MTVRKLEVRDTAVHSAIHEAAQAVAGQAGEAGDQLGYATERLIRMEISCVRR